MVNLFGLWPSKAEKENRKEARESRVRSIEAVRKQSLELHRAIEELRRAREAVADPKQKGQT